MTEIHPGEAQTPRMVIPAKQAVSKLHPNEAQTPPNRHSRESGNPGGVERGSVAVAPLRHPWIPAFAGMTEGDGNDGGAFRTSKLAF